MPDKVKASPAKLSPEHRLFLETLLGEYRRINSLKNGAVFKSIEEVLDGRRQYHVE